MIIRRFVNAIRRQDWGLAALDFLIVVAGIFVGLQVDDWNQQRLEKQSEVGVIALIVTDMEREIEFLDNYTRRFEEALTGAEEVAKQLQSFPDIDVDEFAASIDRSGEGWYWFEFDAAYRNLQQSGKISIISNPELAASIVDYYDGNGAYFAMLARDAREASRSYEKAMRGVLLMYPKFETDTLAYSRPTLADIEKLASDKPFWERTSYALQRYKTSIRIAEGRQRFARNIIGQINAHLETIQ